MKHHLSVLFVVSSMCFLASCQKENVTAPESENKSISVKEKMNELGVPFKASFNNVSQVLAPPPIVQIQITGEGRGSHIGKATLVANLKVNVTTTPLFTISGTAVITAANGDQIFFSVISSRAANVTGAYTHISYNTVTGGTGRFEDATGSFEGTIIANTKSMNSMVSYEGYISY
jgi:hypothetical protein